MPKLMTLVRAAPNLSRDDFASHWRNHYANDVLAHAEGTLSRVVHHHALPSAIREGEGLAPDRWDGVGSYYFDSMAAAENTLRILRADEFVKKHARFIGQATHMIVDEVWLYNRDRSHLPVKMFAFFKRKPAFTRQEALEYYRTTHAAVGEKVNKNRTVRYVQNHVANGYRNADAAFDYDGGPEIWFKNLEVALNLFEDREGMEELGRDEEKFVIRSEIVHFLTDEAVIFERVSA